MSEILVARKLTFIDSFKKKILVFAIDKRGAEWADGWEVLARYPEVLQLCSKSTQEHLDQAFGRWIEPLVKDIRYSSKACLTRWPVDLVECWLWGSCAMQGDPCWNPSKNPCNLYQPGKFESENVRFKLQMLYNIWREGYVAVIVERL